jgi:hypothetical protein
MIDLPNNARELFDIAFSRRQFFNEALYYENDEPTGKLIRQPYMFFNSTTPILDGGFVRPSPCPNLRSSHLDVGLQYEWSPDHQEIFESTIISENFDLRRFQSLLPTYKGHWPKAAALGGHGLDSFSPGISDVLFELGKTKFFRTLRFLIWGFSEEDRIISGEYPAITLNDELIQERGERVRPEHRTRMIAARGMIEYCSQREFIDEFEQILCPICDESFWPQLLEEYEIQELGEPRYCNRCCRLRKDIWSDDFFSIEQRREYAIAGLKIAKELTGTFPHSSFKKEIISTLDESERDLWFVAQVLLPGKSVKELFGSWNDLLVKAGIIDDKPRTGRGGIISQSSCQHLCLSIGERRICDELFRQGIEHDKEPLYPTDTELNPNGKLRADWKVGETFIELAGIMSDTSYAENIARKQRLAAKYNIELLIYLPAELRNVGDLVKSLKVTAGSQNTQTE